MARKNRDLAARMLAANDVHVLDASPRSRKGAIDLEDFLQHPEGPTWMDEEVLLDEAIEAFAQVAPGEEIDILAIDVVRHGRVVRAGYAIDSEGALWWKLDRMRTLVLRMPR